MRSTTKAIKIGVVSDIKKAVLFMHLEKILVSLDRNNELNFSKKVFLN